MQRRKILWGFTGSVATIKYEEIKAQYPNDQVFVIYTQKATHFASIESINDSGHVMEFMNKKEPFWIGIQDSAEWEWKKKSDVVIHIELKKWANAFVVVPCSANSLAKITNGICDCLLLSVARAWDFKVPFIICPCMNTQMYEHPITLEQIDKFIKWGGIFIPPIEKLLACGDYGMGALPAIPDLVYQISDILNNKSYNL